LKIEDLGVLDGDIWLFGGIYSNLQAFEALLEQMNAAKHPPERCICTGDIVAYCANPIEVTELMIEKGIKTIAGNCEKQLAAGAEDCGCGFDAGSVCDLASKGWFAFASQQTATFQSYYAALPDIITFRAFDKRYAVIHGGVTDIASFIWPVSPEAQIATEVSALEALVGEVDGIICGHSGVAFECKFAGKHWINAGVIGMPPHDGRIETRFAILSKDGLRFHRLFYDVETASKNMAQVGLNHGYETSLTSGYWPSEDVLPGALRR
jgi:predicted phosphodiesterase